MSYDADNRVTCTAIRVTQSAFGALPSSACAQSTPTHTDHITQLTYDLAGQKLMEQRGVGSAPMGLGVWGAALWNEANWGTSAQINYATYSYSGDGNVLTILDANSNLTTNMYDGFNRLSKVEYPVTTLGADASDPTNAESYGYDANSNRVTLTKRDGTTVISFAYDSLNRMSAKTFAAPWTSLNVAYGYDLAGRPLSALYANQSGTPGVTWTYDAAGRRITEATNSRALGFTYDADDNPATMTWPDGGQIAYGFDTADRMTSVGDSAASETLGYDSLSRMTSVNRGASASTIGFDNADRLTSLAHAFTPTSGNETWGFTYTPADQVAAASSSNSAWNWPGGPASSATTPADGLNRNAGYVAVGAPCAPSGAGYDCNGNLTFDGTRTFAYDPENRLISESGPVSMALAYDPMGRLQQSAIGGTTTQFLYDGSALVAEYQSGAITARYVHGPADDNPVIAFAGPSMSTSNASYLIADRQGSIVATANSSGAVTAIQTYDAYGVPNAWGGTRFAYTGQIAIPEAHLYYYKARVYDPLQGKFLQTDPVGYGPDVNWYVYVKDDPVNHADPSGMAGCTPSTGTRICTEAQQTQTKALVDVKAARSGLKRLVTERAAVAVGKQESLSASALATQGDLEEHFGTSSDGAISQVDSMLAGVERVLADPGGQYNYQESNIGKDKLGRASIFGSTIKIGEAFLAAGARDREVTEIHESSHKVGANVVSLGVELYERDALRAPISPPFALQNADNYALFVYDSTHR